MSRHHTLPLVWSLAVAVVAGVLLLPAGVLAADDSALSLRIVPSFSRSNLTSEEQHWYDLTWAHEAGCVSTVDSRALYDDLYTYGRSIGDFNAFMLMGLRATGDRGFLDRVMEVTDAMRTKLKDADDACVGGTTDGFLDWRWRAINAGSYSCSNTGGFYGSDHHQLDDAMTHGNIAMVAYAFTVNADIDTAYAARAAFWTDYLLHHWEAKWIQRAGGDSVNAWLDNATGMYKHEAHVVANIMRAAYYLWKITGNPFYKNRADDLWARSAANCVLNPNVPTAYSWHHQVDNNDTWQAENYAEYTSAVFCDLHFDGYTPYASTTEISRFMSTWRDIIFRTSAPSFSQMDPDVYGGGSQISTTASGASAFARFDNTGKLLAYATALSSGSPSASSINVVRTTTGAQVAVSTRGDSSNTTDYWVEPGVGNDSNAGTSSGVGNSWATVGKALATATSGDRVHLGTGSHASITNPPNGTVWMGNAASDTAAVVSGVSFGTHDSVTVKWVKTTGQISAGSGAVADSIYKVVQRTSGALLSIQNAQQLTLAYVTGSTTSGADRRIVLGVEFGSGQCDPDTSSNSTHLYQMYMTYCTWIFPASMTNGDNSMYWWGMKNCTIDHSRFLRTDSPTGNKGSFVRHYGMFNSVLIDTYWEEYATCTSCEEGDNWQLRDRSLNNKFVRDTLIIAGPGTDDNGRAFVFSSGSCSPYADYSQFENCVIAVKRMSLQTPRNVSFHGCQLITQDSDFYGRDGESLTGLSITHSTLVRPSGRVLLFDGNSSNTFKGNIVYSLSSAGCSFGGGVATINSGVARDSNLYFRESTGTHQIYVGGCTSPSSGEDWNDPLFNLNPATATFESIVGAIKAGQSPFSPRTGSYALAATPGAKAWPDGYVGALDNPVVLPTVTFTSASQASSDETNGSTMTITAELSEVWGDDVTVPFTVNGASTATGGGTDYSITASPIVIAAGNTTADITITIAGDALDEADETVIVDMGAPTNATQGATTQHTATITDDDAPPSVAWLLAAQGSPSESGDMRVTALLSATSGRNVTVPFSVNVSSTTEAGVDYTITSSPITIPAGSDSAHATITINGDPYDEVDETVIVDMGSPTNASQGATVQHVATIIDDDSPPDLSINDVQLAEGNSGTTAFSFTVSLSLASTKTITVNYATQDGSAVAPGDYTAIGSTQLTFNPGETTKPVSVSVNGDTDVEFDEDFTVQLSGAVNATIADASGLGTILTDDTATPTVSWTLAAQAATEVDAATMRITAALSTSSGSDVTVPFTINPSSTAAAGTDYSMDASPLVIPAGQDSATAVITIIGDPYDEPDETIVVNMGTPVNATQGATTTETATILDNDAPPTLSINDVQHSEGNSGTTAYVFTVSLSPASAKTVSVDYATADATAVAPTDYTAVGTTQLVFSPGETEKTPQVSVNGDTDVESDEMFEVNLTNASNATVADAQGIGSILNDDGASVPAVDAVADLEELTHTAYTVTLAWTTPAGDASAWTLAYSSDSTLTATSFSRQALLGTDCYGNAALYYRCGAPKSAGARDTVVVRQLQPGTTYEFSIKYRDSAGMWAGMSPITTSTCEYCGLE